MAKMNMLQAINNALDLAMAKDDGVVCFDEDVGHFGGVFRALVPAPAPAPAAAPPVLAVIGTSEIFIVKL